MNYIVPVTFFLFDNQIHLLIDEAIAILGYFILFGNWIYIDLTLKEK